MTPLRGFFESSQFDTTRRAPVFRRLRLSGVLGAVMLHIAVLGVLWGVSSSRIAGGVSRGQALSGEVSVSLLPSMPQRAAQAPASSEAAPKKHAVAASAENGEAIGAGGSPSRSAQSDEGSAVSDLSASNDGIISDYHERLLAHIARFQHYPDDARKAGMQGTIYLTFELSRDGEIGGIWVVRSSGYPRLDEAALETIRRAAPMPPIPARLPERLAVPLPIRFSLTIGGD